MEDKAGARGICGFMMDMCVGCISITELAARGTCSFYTAFQYRASQGRQTKPCILWGARAGEAHNGACTVGDGPTAGWRMHRKAAGKTLVRLCSRRGRSRGLGHWMAGVVGRRGGGRERSAEMQGRGEEGVLRRKLAACGAEGGGSLPCTWAHPATLPSTEADTIWPRGLVWKFCFPVHVPMVGMENSWAKSLPLY